MGNMLRWTALRAVCLAMAMLLVPLEGRAEMLDDDFSGGLGKWSLFGHPKPVIRQNIHGRAVVFDNMGDPNHNSGAVSRATVGGASGFSLESAVYVDVTDVTGCWNHAGLGLTRQADPGWVNDGDDREYGVLFDLGYAGDACWATPEPYRRRGHMGIGYLDETGTWRGYEEESRFFADAYMNKWVNLRIDVAADRTIRFHADNTLIWAPRWKAHQDLLRGRNVVLGLRSSGSAGKAYHDHVRVAPLTAGSASPGGKPAGAPQPGPAAPTQPGGPGPVIASADPDHDITRGESAAITVTSRIPHTVQAGAGAVHHITISKAAGNGCSGWAYLMEHSCRGTRCWHDKVVGKVFFDVRGITQTKDGFVQDAPLREGWRKLHWQIVTEAPPTQPGVYSPNSCGTNFGDKFVTMPSVYQTIVSAPTATQPTQTPPPSAPSAPVQHPAATIGNNGIIEAHFSVAGTANVGDEYTSDQLSIFRHKNSTTAFPGNKSACRGTASLWASWERTGMFGGSKEVTKKIGERQFTTQAWPADIFFMDRRDFPIRLKFTEKGTYTIWWEITGGTCGDNFTSQRKTVQVQ